MDNREFLYHLHIIKEMRKNPVVRIVLMHPQYTQPQQKIIDAISRESVQIIGQVLRKPPIVNAAREVKRLVLAHHEPFISKDKLRYVILGQQKNIPENF